MAIIPTGKAILKMSIVLSPIIISILILLLSFMEGNLSGIIYLSGMILAQLIGFLARPFFGKSGIRPDIKEIMEDGEVTIKRDRACSIIDDPYYSQYSSPSFHALFHSFTFIYHFMAQFLAGWKNLDWLKFIILLIFWVFDANFRIGSNCVYPHHYFIGIFFGIVLGVLWYYLVKDLNSNMLLKGTSDKKKCEIINSNMTCPF
jgi:hypothetical protein